GDQRGENNQQNKPTRRNLSEAQSNRLSRKDRRKNRDQKVLYEGGNYPSNAARQRNLPIPGGSHWRNHASHRSRRRFGNRRCHDGGGLLSLSIRFPHQAGLVGQAGWALSMRRMDLPGLLGLPYARGVRAISMLQA